jgi:hypothetical protein
MPSILEMMEQLAACRNASTVVIAQWVWTASVVVGPGDGDELDIVSMLWYRA